MHELRGERSAFASNTRHRVYTKVAENAGASIQDVATMLGISHPTAAYHLKILERNGLVVAMRDGNRTRFFKRSDALTPDEQRLVAAGRSARARRILEIVRRQPLIHRKELARLLGLPRTTVNWHVDRLVQMGLLVERRQGRYCQLFLPLHLDGSMAARAALAFLPAGPRAPGGAEGGNAAASAGSQGAGGDAGFGSSAGRAPADSGAASGA